MASHHPVQHNLRRGSDTNSCDGNNCLVNQVVECFTSEIPETNSKRSSDLLDTSDQPQLLCTWSSSPGVDLKQDQILKQGIWSWDETERLKQNILKYCDDFSIEDPCEIIFNSGKEKRKNFYKKVALGINRPLFSVYRRVVRMYDSKNHMGKYSQEELKRLRELRKQYGNDWQKIGLAMGRSAASIKDRCRHLKDGCKTGPWKAEEEDRLSEAVYSFTQSLPGDEPVPGTHWIKIAKLVGTRSERQCRKKWLSYCNLKRVVRVDWDKEDELYLATRLSQSEKSDEMHVAWTELAQTWPRPSLRSQQWLRAKWKQLRSTIEDHLNLSFKEICCRLIKELSESGVRLVNLTTSSKSGLEIVSDAYSGTDNSELSQSLTGSTRVAFYSSSDRRISYVSNICHGAGYGTSANSMVAHMDSDGGEEPAVTTDVMLSGSSLCARGSPLGLGNKSDQESDEHSSSSK